MQPPRNWVVLKTLAVGHRSLEATGRVVTYPLNTKKEVENAIPLTRTTEVSYPAGGPYEGPDRPLLLEGGTGIGKTRAYLAAIAGYAGQVAIVLPTHQLIDQLRPPPIWRKPSRCSFSSGPVLRRPRAYERQREAAKVARVLVCTAASVIIDHRLNGQYNGATTAITCCSTSRWPARPCRASARPGKYRRRIGWRAGGGFRRPRSPDRTWKRCWKSAGSTPTPPAALMRSIVADPKFITVAANRRRGRPTEWNRRHLLPGRLLRKISNRPTPPLSARPQHRRKLPRQNLWRLPRSRFSTAQPDTGERAFLPDADPAAVIAEAARPCLVVMTSFKTAASLKSHKHSRTLKLRLGEALKAASAPRWRAGAVKTPENNRQGMTACRRPAPTSIAVAAWAGLTAVAASIVVPDTLLPWKSGKPQQFRSRNVGICRMRR